MADEKVHLGIEGIGPATLLGRGGSAFVYQAEQVDFGRQVAVKILFDALEDDATYKRFDRECRAIGAASNHPNIVVVHGRGLTADDRPYLIMEHRPGGSLAERLAVRGRFPEAEAIQIGIKIGRALQVAHDAGVLHRDVKPANILLSAYNEPALADFGIARVEGGHKTTEGVFSASVVYASREILDSGDPTPRSDVYSLGSTLYELVTGSPAFADREDASVWAIINRVLTEDVPDPALHGVSDGLAATLSKAMNHDPDKRHRSAAAFVADLEALRSGRGVAAATTEPVPEITAKPQEPSELKTTKKDEAVPNSDATEPPLPIEDPRGDSPVVSRTGVILAVATVAAASLVAGVVGLIVVSRSVGPADSDIEAAANAADQTRTSVSAFSDALAPSADDPEFEGRSSGDDDQDTIRGDAALPFIAPQLVFPRAEIGPLEASGRYVLTLDVVPEDASYRIIVDGRRTTDYQPTIPIFFPEPGRHQIQLQVAVDESVHLTDPIEIYVSEPPEPGFRTNLSSIRSRPENWPEALRQFDQLVLDGHSELELSLSTRSEPGRFPFWNYYIDGFGNDQAAAEAYCEDFDLAEDDCFVAEV